jgi:hypothetical protein
VSPLTLLGEGRACKTRPARAPSTDQMKLPTLHVQTHKTNRAPMWTWVWGRREHDAGVLDFTARFPHQRRRCFLHRELRGGMLLPPPAEHCNTYKIEAAILSFPIGDEQSTKSIYPESIQLWYVSQAACDDLGSPSNSPPTPIPPSLDLCRLQTYMPIRGGDLGLLSAGTVVA